MRGTVCKIVGSILRSPCSMGTATQIQTKGITPDLLLQTQNQTASKRKKDNAALPQ